MCLWSWGQAYVNGKKIFLLNPIPDMPYKDEIIAVSPVVITAITPRSYEDHPWFAVKRTQESDGRDGFGVRDHAGGYRREGHSP